MTTRLGKKFLVHKLKLVYSNLLIVKVKSEFKTLISDIFIYSTSIDQTQSNIKADQKSWPQVYFVPPQGYSQKRIPQGLLLQNLHLLWVYSGSTQSLLLVYSGPALRVRITQWWDRLTFFLPPVSPPLVYSKYTSRDMWSFSVGV